MIGAAGPVRPTALSDDVPGREWNGGFRADSNPKLPFVYTFPWTTVPTRSSRELKLGHLG